MNIILFKSGINNNYQNVGSKILQYVFFSKIYTFIGISVLKPISKLPFLKML